jgi:hypothetical protein
MANFKGKDWISVGKQFIIHIDANKKSCKIRSFYGCRRRDLIMAIRNSPLRFPFYKGFAFRVRMDIALFFEIEEELSRMGINIVDV